MRAPSRLPYEQHAGEAHVIVVIGSDDAGAAHVIAGLWESKGRVNALVGDQLCSAAPST